MEQVEFGDDRSSISDPLDPEDERLIWSGGSFLELSLTDRKLEDENFINNGTNKSNKKNIHLYKIIQDFKSMFYLYLQL